MRMNKMKRGGKAGGFYGSGKAAERAKKAPIQPHTARAIVAGGGMKFLRAKSKMNRIVKIQSVPKPEAAPEQGTQDSAS